MKARFTSALVAVAAAGLSAGAAFAQDIVGSSSIKGRTVELLSDNTWRYKSAGGADCTSLGYRMEFCGQTLGWDVSRPLSAEASGSFRLGSRDFAVTISEPFGAGSGMSLDTLTQAATVNAALGAGISEKDVAVNSVDDVEVLGFAARRLSYTLSFNGLKMTFINTFWVEQDQSTQFITWTAGQPDAAMLKTHTDALATIKTVN
jgi:hypothetical protein